MCTKALAAELYEFKFDKSDAGLYIELAVKAQGCGERRDRRAGHAFDECSMLQILDENYRSYTQLECGSSRRRRAGHAAVVSKAAFCQNQDEILEGTFAKTFHKDSCGDFGDKAAAVDACNSRRQRKAAHAAAAQKLACGCAATYDYEIPAALGTVTKSNPPIRVFFFFFGNSRTLVGCTDPLRGGKRTPSVFSRVGSKLPLPLVV